MIGRAVWLAAALAVAAPSSGCAFAVEHPTITAGVVGGVIGLGTCKLASDNIGSCLAVGGGAGAFLGLVAAAAIWLGGDGNTAPVEEQAQPLPEDGHPAHRRHRAHVPVEGDPAAPPAPAPLTAPVAPAPLTPAAALPAPASPSAAPPAAPQ